MGIKLYNTPTNPVIRNIAGALYYCFCVFFLACAIVCIASQPAEARSYTLPQTVIDAQIDNAGSLHVQEARSFNFDGDFSLVYFKLDPPQGSQLEVQTVSVIEGMPEKETLATSLADHTQLGLSLEEIKFKQQWRKSGGPEKPSFAFDQEQNTLYAFLGSEQAPVTGTYTVVVRYTINAAVQLYQDEAQLYWQYIPAGWEEVSENVFAQIRLPYAGVYNPEDKLVRVWGHGSLDSSWSFNDKGWIVLKNPRVASGTFAEVRVLFPLDWIVHTKGLSQHNTPITEIALQEEQDFANKANEERMRLQILFVLGIGGLILALLAGVYLIVRARRELRPQFQEKYWRDIPDAQAPAVCIARLMRGNVQTSEDLSFAILELAQKGLVRLGFDSEEHKTFFGSKQKACAYIELTPQGNELLRACLASGTSTESVSLQAAVVDIVIKRTLEFLFMHIAGINSAPEDVDKDALIQVGRRLYLEDLKAIAREHPEAFSEHYDAWTGIIGTCMNRLDYFGRMNNRSIKLLFVLIAVLIIAGIGIGMAIENLFLLSFAYFALALVFLFNTLALRLQLSMHGREVRARTLALKNWLKDFSRIHERPCSDIAVWGQFMVYACVLDVAKEALKNIQDMAPEFVDYNAETLEAEGFIGIPWWMLYYASSLGHVPHNEGFAPEGFDFGQALNESINTSISSVHEALSSASDASGFGDLGFGGGFSMGGGGGFGGGGGGGAR